jgi:hypothetical protein
MGEERDADTDSRTCTGHDPANDFNSRKLITNVGQCGQDNTTVQTEGMIKHTIPRKQPQKLTGYHRSARLSPQYPQ